MGGKPPGIRGGGGGADDPIDGWNRAVAEPEREQGDPGKDTEDRAIPRDAPFGLAQEGPKIPTHSEEHAGAEVELPAVREEVRHNAGEEGVVAVEDGGKIFQAEGFLPCHEGIEVEDGDEPELSGERQQRNDREKKNRGQSGEGAENQPAAGVRTRNPKPKHERCGERHEEKGEFREAEHHGGPGKGQPGSSAKRTLIGDPEKSPKDERREDVGVACHPVLEIGEAGGHLRAQHVKKGGREGAPG